MKTSAKFFAAILFAVFFLSFIPEGKSINIIAQWDFEGNVNTPSLLDPNLTMVPATFGPSIGAITYYGGNGSASAYAGNNWATTPVYNPDSYLEFTLSPVTGYMMTIYNFSLFHRRSSTGIRDWEIRSSLDNFTTVLATGNIPDNTNWHPASCILPAQFTDVSVPVSFRIYGFSAEGATGTWRFDDVTFIGITAELPPPVPLANWAVAIGILLIVSSVIIRYRKLA